MASAPDQAPAVDPPPPPDTVDSPLPPSPDVVPTTPSDPPPPPLPPSPPPPSVELLGPPPPFESIAVPPAPPPRVPPVSPSPSPPPPPPVDPPPPPVDPSPPPPVDPSPPPPVDPPPPLPIVEPPTVSPPPPDVFSPPPPIDAPPPAPSTDSPPPVPGISPPPPLNLSPPPPSPLLSPPTKIPSPPGAPSIKPISPPPPPASRSSVSAPVVVAAALGSVAFLLAVFGLFWFLFFRKKRERDPPGTESFYRPGDGFNGASVQSGQTNYPPSGEHPSLSNGSPFPLAPGRSMSNSTGNSSSQPHPMSTSGTGWSESSGPDHSSLSSMQGILGSGTISFTYDELKIATNGFSSVNLLGQGGFGYVHKGMLQNGKIVAVKSLKADSGQGEREFQAEVETISRVHHKHLVTLVGYCITDSQKLLVYEFVQNKTLEFHLHGKGQPVLDWPTRLKIAIGSAKGLAYLHEDCHPRIIHRDIKAANILLDHTFEAQVADFGLAKFSSGAETHISTRVMGTFGYLAPEYASTGQLSDKSDVFSFGVLLLELISGRRPVDFTSHAETEDSLVDWARPLLSKAIQDGNLDPLVDPRLENNYNLEEMGAMVTCAASCVRHSAKRRPQLSQVVRALEGNLALADLNDGVTPGFSSFYSQTDLYSPKSEERLRFRKTVFRSGDGNSTSSDSRPTESELTSGR